MARFCKNEQLTPEQEVQFGNTPKYSWNGMKNEYTRITSLADIIEYHYRDAFNWADLSICRPFPQSAILARAVAFLVFPSN